MKFIKKILEFIFSKKILVLFLLIANNFIETNQNIAIGKIKRYKSIKSEMKENATYKMSKFTSKTFRYKMTGKAKIKFGLKLKYFLVGFLAPILSYLLNRILDANTIKNLLIPIIDLCIVDSFDHYENLFQNAQRELNCDPKLPYKVIPDKWKTQIQGVCSKKRSIDDLDKEQFSSINVILGYIKNIFTDNSQFIEDYEKFKADYKATEKKIKEMNKYYSDKFKEEKEKYKEGSAERKYLLTVINDLDRSLFSKNICEIFEYCQNLTLWQRIKIQGNTAFHFVQCIPKAIMKISAFEYLYQILKDLLEKVGFQALFETLISGILPPAFFSLVLTLLIKGWDVLAKMISLSWTYQPDKSTYERKERDLFLSIGGFLGNLFSIYIGLISPKNSMKGAIIETFGEDLKNMAKKAILGAVEDFFIRELKDTFFNIIGRRKYRRVRELSTIKK